MQNAASVKVGVAFLAGVALALGGAFIYLRAGDSDLHPALLIPTAVETLPTPDQKNPEPPVPPPDASPAQPPAVKATRVIVKTRRPVSLAVWRPRNQPVVQPAIQSIPDPPPDAAPPPSESESVSPPAAEPPAVTARQPHTVTLPAGTTLSVRLNEQLSTEHNFSGDTFRATLDTPIIVDGFIIADRGAKVLGRIVRAQKPGKMQGMAELSLALSQIATTDGQRLSVETNESLRKGPSNTNEEVIKMAGGAALGAIIGAIAGGGKGAAIGAGAGGAAGTGAVLLGRGKPATIENETRLDFELASPATITEHLN